MTKAGNRQFAIATTEDVLTPAQRLALMHDIRSYVGVAFRKDIRTYSIHPHGIGIYEFMHPCDRDILVRNQIPDDEVPPPPNNGNPHPHEGPVLLEEPEQVAQWADEPTWI
nr:unnamed protein product [Digitaria exilis]